jgi:hypothetical protein
MEPALLCQTGSDDWANCDRETACAADAFKIDYDNPDTIKNLVTYMDLICKDGYHSMLAMVGAVTLLGCLVGSIVLLP